MRNELKALSSKLCPLFAVFLLSQGMTGCISANAPDPTVVTASIKAAAVTGPTPTPIAVIPRANEQVYVTASAVITQGGGIARGNNMVVFASIGGATGSRTVAESHGVGGCLTNQELPNCNVSSSIQQNGSVAAVTGAGSIAFTGIYGDSR